MLHPLAGSSRPAISLPHSLPSSLLGLNRSQNLYQNDWRKKSPACHLLFLKLDHREIQGKLLKILFSGILDIQFRESACLLLRWPNGLFFSLCHLLMPPLPKLSLENVQHERGVEPASRSVGLMTMMRRADRWAGLRVNATMNDPVLVAKSPLLAKERRADGASVLPNKRYI